MSGESLTPPPRAALGHTLALASPTANTRALVFVPLALSRPGKDLKKTWLSPRKWRNFEFLHFFYAFLHFSMSFLHFLHFCIFACLHLQASPFPCLPFFAFFPFFLRLSKGRSFCPLRSNTDRKRLSDKVTCVKVTFLSCNKARVRSQWKSVPSLA